MGTNYNYSGLTNKKSGKNTGVDKSLISDVANDIVNKAGSVLSSDSELFGSIIIDGKTIRNGEGYTSGSGRKIKLNLKEDIDLTEHQPLYPYIELSIGGVVISDFGDSISDCVIDFTFDRSTSADSGYASSKFVINLYDDTALEIEELLYAGMDTRDYTSSSSDTSLGPNDYEKSDSTEGNRNSVIKTLENNKKGKSKTEKNTNSSRYDNNEPLGPHGAYLLRASSEDNTSNGSEINNSDSSGLVVGTAKSAVEKAISDIQAKEYKELFDNNLDRWKSLSEDALEEDEDFNFFRTVSGISPTSFKKYIAQGDSGISRMKELYETRLDRFIKESNSPTGDVYSDIKEQDVKNIEIDYGWANHEGKKILSNTIKGNYTKYQLDFEEGTVNLTIEGMVQSAVQAGNVKSEFYDGETYKGSPSEIVKYICESENIPVGKIEETEPITDDEGNPVGFTRNNCSADRFIVNKLCEEATSAETGTVGFVFFIGEDNKAYFVATNRVGELGVKAKNVSGVDRSSYAEEKEETEEENLGYSSVLTNSFDDYFTESDTIGPLGVSFPTVGQLTGTNKDVIIVGDSRTNGIRLHSHGGSGTEYDGVNSEGVRIICKGGSGYKWLKDVAVPKVDRYSKSGTRIVFWQGVNDAWSESLSMADKYVSLLNPKIQQWVSKGCAVFYATIGPVRGTYTLNSHHLNDTSVNNFTNKLKAGLVGVSWIDAYAILRKHTDAELFAKNDAIHYYTKSINMELYNAFVSGAGSSMPVVNGVATNVANAVANSMGSSVYENVEVPEELEITGYYEYNSGKKNNKVISFSPEYKDVVMTARAMLPSNVYSVDPLRNQMFECTIDHGESSDVMSVVKDRKYLVMGMSSASYSKLEKIAQSMYDRYQSSMYDATMDIMGDPLIKVFKWIYVAVFTKHGFLHHSSGIYFIKSASDSLSRGEFTTTLSLQKLGSEQTMNMGKEEIETMVQSDSPVIGNQEIRAVSGEWSWPLPSGYTRVSSPFGARSKSLSKDGFHSGIDLSAPGGTEILASKAGTVFSITRNGSQIGNSVTLKHEGDPVAYSLYHHMSRIGNVTEGQQVAQGQVIGYVGSTGHSTGNHLHFEIRIGGNRRGSLNNTDCVDPQTLLTKPE